MSKLSYRMISAMIALEKRGGKAALRYVATHPTADALEARGLTKSSWVSDGAFLSGHWDIEFTDAGRAWCQARNDRLHPHGDEAKGEVLHA